MPDTFDDLLHAEERIEALTEALAAVVESWHASDVITAPGGTHLAIARAGALLTQRYCRTTCYGFTGPCPTCGGLGLVTRPANFAGTPILAESVCPTCSGDGDGCNADDCACPCGHPTPTITTQETPS